MAVRHQTTKENTWSAWSGELEDLRRIGRLFSSLVEQRRAPLWAAISGEYVVNPETPGAESVAERRKADFDRRWKAVATLQDGDDQIEGPINEVLAELDPRTISRLEFSATSHYIGAAGDAIGLTFNKENLFQPVVLDVRSSDQGWARQALTSLSEEIERGVPKWARWRSFLGKMGVSVAICLVVYLIATILLPSSLHTWIRTLTASAIAIAVALVATSFRSLDWFLPPFEVRSQGTSTGGRRIAGLALLLLSVPIGILVNILTR
jgi:hypothetical protein